MQKVGKFLDCDGLRVPLDRPQVMGVLNVTPDSFSDGGDFFSLDAAVARGRDIAAQGAAIIDVGGESTRPGAEPVGIDEEIARVVPVIERLHAALPDAVISIDTGKPEVMRAAAAAGATLINDVRALRAEGAIDTALELGLPVCLMHMRGEPRTMQINPIYVDVVTEVRDFLATRIEACLQAGMPRGRLLIDPGFGFGKLLEHNLTLLRRLDELMVLDAPIVVGLSRKSMIGQLLGAPAGERLCGSIALATIAAWQGASIVRAHDVRETVEALRVCGAVREVDQDG